MHAPLSRSSSPLAPTLPAWLDTSLYPFSPRGFATAEGTIRYVDTAPGGAVEPPRGRPVVIAHGTPSWSFEWRAVIEALRANHRVIVPDHLGFGLSDKPVDTSVLAPAAHARRLAALVRHLELTDALLVGHDFGGPIGAGALLAEPARFSAVLLSNTWLWSLADRADVRRISRLVASPLGKLLYRGFNASPRWIVPKMFGERFTLEERVHRHYTAPFPTWAARAAPWKLGVELAGSASFYDELWNHRAELAKLPTAIVWGRADPTFGDRELARLTDVLPRAQVHALEDVGHFPAEEAVDALVNAVRALDGGGLSMASSRAPRR